MVVSCTVLFFLPHTQLTASHCLGRSLLLSLTLNSAQNCLQWPAANFQGFAVSFPVFWTFPMFVILLTFSAPFYIFFFLSSYFDIFWCQLLVKCRDFTTLWAFLEGNDLEVNNQTMLKRWLYDTSSETHSGKCRLPLCLCTKSSWKGTRCIHSA